MYIYINIQENTRYFLNSSGFKRVSNQFDISIKVKKKSDMVGRYRIELNLVRKGEHFRKLGQTDQPTDGHAGS